MKFKVGDKVRIRKDAVVDQLYNGVTLFSWMKEEAEDVNEITYVRDDGRCEIDTTSYIYDFSMFELIEDSNTSEKFVIYRDKNKTIAKYYKGDKTVTAEAKCSPEDEFSFEYGAKLAMDRAIEKMEEEERVYTNIICTWSRYANSPNCVGHFTEGKMYKVSNDGHIYTDMGFDWRQYAQNCQTKDSILNTLSLNYNFVEVN